MNLHFGLFCGFDFLLSRDNAWQWNSKKTLLIPILHMLSCLVSIHRKMWFQQQTLCSHQRLSLPRVVPVLRWGIFVRKIFVSPYSEFEQHMYSSDLRTDTVSFMELDSRRAVPQVSQPPFKASARTFNSTTRQPRSEKPLQTSALRTAFFCVFFFFFSFLFFDSRPGSC